MPKRNPHPHVSWRDGRPRFQPGRDLRAAGYSGRDLRHEDGRWFTRGEAVDWSVAFQRDLAARKTAAATPARGRAAGKPAPRAYTVSMMVADWQQSPRWRAGEARALGEKTKVDYRQKLRIVEDDHPLIWNAPAHLVTRQALRAMFEEVWTARGLASARGAILALSSCYSWAVLRGKVRRADNPALKLKMEVPEPRVRFGTRPEIEHLVRTADAMGRPEAGDMILLAVWTGQRQGDRIRMVDKGLYRGRRHFRQAKTGAIVAILEAPELERRLAASRERRRAVRAERLMAARPDEREAIETLFAHAVLDEKRWVPFSGDHWTRTFAELRAAAAVDMPSLASLWDLDLRDTAVTWMALAGATIPQIIAVTGHTAESATRILKHYLARHPEMADEAMRKMIEWYAGNGETEIGL